MPRSESTPLDTALTTDQTLSQNTAISSTDHTLDNGLPSVSSRLQTQTSSENQPPTRVSATSGPSDSSTKSSTIATFSPKSSSFHPSSSHSVVPSTPAVSTSTSFLTSPTTSQKPTPPVALFWDQRDITHGQGAMRCTPAKCVYPCDAGITLDINLCPVCLCRSALSLSGTK